MTAMTFDGQLDRLVANWLSDAESREEIMLTLQLKLLKLQVEHWNDPASQRPLARRAEDLQSNPLRSIFK